MRFQVVRCTAVAVATFTFALPLTAEAKQRFQAYEGRDAIAEGRGGTKVTAHGVDFWTTGEPPRRFQVLGQIIDKRGTGVLAGDAVGSAGVAKKVKEVGGDAVIMGSTSERTVGYVSNGQVFASGNMASAHGFAMPVGKAVTQMTVIKYLDPPTP